MTRSIRRTLCWAALLSLPSIAVRPATAQSNASTTPGTERAAGELLQTMRMQDQWNARLTLMVDNTIVRQPSYEPYRAQMFAFYSKYLGWAVVEPRLRRIYAQEFTEAELRDVIAFYRTPTGQKAAARAPDVISRLSSVETDIITAHKDEWTMTMKARAQEIKDSASKGARPSF